MKYICPQFGDDIEVAHGCLMCPSCGGNLKSLWEKEDEEEQKQLEKIKDLTEGLDQIEQIINNPGYTKTYWDRNLLIIKTNLDVARQYMCRPDYVSQAQELKEKCLLAKKKINKSRISENRPYVIKTLLVYGITEVLLFLMIYFSRTGDQKTLENVLIGVLGGIGLIAGLCTGGFIGLFVGAGIGYLLALLVKLLLVSLTGNIIMVVIFNVIAVLIWKFAIYDKA